MEQIGFGVDAGLGSSFHNDQRRSMPLVLYIFDRCVIGRLYYHFPQNSEVLGFMMFRVRENVEELLKLLLVTREPPNHQNSNRRYKVTLQLFHVSKVSGKSGNMKQTRVEQ